MNIDRWQQILQTVRSSFEVEDEGTETSDERGGTEIEFIVFNGPLGRLRLEFETHGALTGTKTFFKKRVGAEISVEQTYSPTEKVHHFSVWKWDEAMEEWNEFQSSMFT
ncbi:MAG TPA: hypothetical protein PK720_00745 [bacterium]|jgi:hypothetical protein|nr:hypothetical protein [bacterium]